MSRYTTELRTVCDLFGRETVEGWFKDYELSDYLTSEEIAVIEERGTWSKDKLAQKIVNHYLMCEIGYETPAYFRHQVINDMRELMEEYAPLIYSAAIKYNPMVNVDFTETYHQTETGNATNTGTTNSRTNSNGTGLQIQSDTPQGQVNKQSILNGDYATNTAANESQASATDTSETNSNTDSNTESDYVKTTKGNSGVSATAQKMIAQYRDNIRAIDREIIDKLSRNFMGIF
jgi:hypothetical protein